MPKCLVVGSGGREHALAKVLVESASKPEVIALPGNAGIAEIAQTVAVEATDVDRIVQLSRGMDLVVVGPEAPLVLGLADALRAEGIAVLGPNRAAAELEGSKAFAKRAMRDAGVPTARWDVFEESEAAIRFAGSIGRAVVKADGLAAGKGVVVCDSTDEAAEAIRSILGGLHGEAGRRVVVEERLEGEELSVIALVDGERIMTLAPSQDHKRA